MPKQKFKVTLPGIAEVELEPSVVESRAAWELYVELNTRIATQPMPDDFGLFREVLTSLHDLFKITREILRSAGPEVGASSASVGGIAMGVLNGWLRPFLTKWHPMILEWEATRPPDIGAHEHEQNHPQIENAKEELHDLRTNLDVYAQALLSISQM